MKGQNSITGYVIDDNDLPVIGATILEKNTENFITTDFVGFFELELENEKSTIIISYLGFKTKEVKVKANEKDLKILLKAEKEELSEIVISGSLNKRKKDKKKRKYKTEIDDRSIAIATDSSPGRVYDVKTSSEPVKSAPIAPPPPLKPSDSKIDKVAKEETYTYSWSDDGVDEVESLSEGTYTVVVTESSAAVSTIVNENLPEAGQLTGGILNDFGKWNLWQDIQENELKDWQMRWEISPWDRYTVQLTTENGYPIVNAHAILKVNKKIIWEAKTDNTGKAELWANMFEATDANNFNIEINYKNEKYLISDVNDFHEGINVKKLPVICDIPSVVDIAFVVDATGSMGDEINYLKSELKDVINRSKKELKDVDVRLGSVFYRDHGDAYLTRKSHFSSDIEKTVNFIQKQGAAGGGDGPEAIEDALEVALQELSWRENATSRLMFLVLDAPPHETKEIKNRIKKQIIEAAKMGVRIVPVACSGTDRSTEYLMRSICLATNGSYVYLTDDSGIGGSHLKPVTDEHNVELLNDILVKTILDFSKTNSCEEQLPMAAYEELQDTAQVELIVQIKDENNPDKIIEKKEFAWKYYPNPSIGYVKVELEGELDFMYLIDGAGKLLTRIEINDPYFELDLRQYPSGIYYLRGIGKEGREVTGKVVLVHRT